MGTQQIAFLCHSRWQCRCNYHHPAYPDGLKAKTSCLIFGSTDTSRRQSASPAHRSQCANPHSVACGAAPSTTRVFVPCSFSDAGPRACGETLMGPASEKLNTSRHENRLNVAAPG